MGSHVGKWRWLGLIILPAFVALTSIGAEGCRLGDGGLIGEETCLACHDGRTGPDQTSFLEAPHSSFFTCEDCHGPGLNHASVAGRGGLFIEEFNSSTPPEDYELCGTCHPTQYADYVQSGHAVLNGGAVCGDCHNVHTDGELRAPAETNALCLQCHWKSRRPGAQEEAVDLHTGIMHPVDPAGSGASRCTGCHMLTLADDSLPGNPPDHTLFTVPPSVSIDAVTAGITPIPPNSCAGVAGCHDADVPGSGFPHEADNSVLNAALQNIYDSIGQP